jgi:CubicO group peptidase (beta-lactamase class C family)
VAQIMPRLKKVPLDFQPGTRWAYSGQFGFDVLLRVVEVASGMPFDQFARQRIFDPLGMKDTSFYPAAGNPRIATLYEQASGSLRKASNPAFMNGVYLSGGGRPVQHRRGLSAVRADAAQSWTTRWQATVEHEER